jgi:tetratricopeptide (TPR) repeat protein
MTDAQTHFERGKKYLNQDKLDEAIAEFKEAIRINPNYACAYCRLGATYSAKRELDSAIAAYEKAIEMKPGCADVHYCLGNAYKHERMLDDAIVAYREAIRLKPDHANAHHFLGHVYFDGDMLDEAIAEWRETIELTPDDARLYKDLRSAYFKAGRLDELIEEAKRRLETDASDARVHYLLALALAEKWETEQAVESFRKAIELDPSYEAAHEGYIELMEDQGRGAEVRAEYEGKAGAQPDNELYGKLLERIPPVRKRLISSTCAFCLGRGIFNLAYLQFILLVGISGAIESFAHELTSFTYLALVIYVVAISTIYSSSVVIIEISKLKESIDKIRSIDLGPALKLTSVAIGLLVGLLRYVPITIIAYAAMQIFHANWWMPTAASGVLYKIVTSELKALKNTRRLKPLEDPILIERLTELVERCDVRVKGILRMDTDDPFAGVVGMLLPRRILIGDSILRRLSVPDVEAVLAHELGHIKVGTLRKRFLAQSTLAFVRLYSANLIYGILFPAYGFSDPDRIAALPLLAFCWLILGPLFKAIRSWASRFFEREADRYAISVVGESSFSSVLGKILPTRQRQILSPIFDFVCLPYPRRERRLHASKHD